MNYILGFDLGTSSCKSVIYDEKLQYVCQTIQEYPTMIPQQGWAEQPASQWWDAFCKSVKNCIEKAGIQSKDIVVVSIDSMGSVALPIDKDGNDLYPGLLWMDRRANYLCPRIEACLSDDLLKISGNRNDPSNVAPKIVWFKEKRPDIYKKAYKFLHANGFLIYKLTGVMSQDRTECGLTELYDMHKREWSDTLFDALELDKSKMPRVYECDDIVGKITKAAAQASGLAQGTPVVAGSMDCMASMLGTASTQNGDVAIAGGTVSGVGVVTDKFNPQKALHLHNHIVPGKYIHFSAVDFGGGGMRWFRDTIGAKDYNDINKWASMAPPGNDGLLFLPYMVGQRAPLYNNNTTGVMFGLTPRHSKENITRMFMEGTSYAIRNILEYFRVAGSNPKNAKLTGGISNSDVWSQILCDIMDIDIDCPAANDIATLGSAITGAVGIGLYSNYDDAVDRQKISKQYHVNQDNKETYYNMFSIFRNVFNNMLFSYEYASCINNRNIGG